MYQGNSASRTVALGGVLAALALCVMWLGGLLGIATYVSPMLCAILLQIVKNICGNRLGWAWYGAVAILSLLLVSDREAAWVFVFLGYYPLVKPWLDRRRLPFLWKGLLFNGSIGILYTLLVSGTQGGVCGHGPCAADFTGGDRQCELFPPGSGSPEAFLQKAGPLWRINGSSTSFCAGTGRCIPALPGTRKSD